MLASTLSSRRGLSLTEILVSLFIMAVGIISLITLFPVGIYRVRQAVIDTRATYLAISADSIVRGQDWPNDPFLLMPPDDPTAATFAWTPPNANDPPVPNPCLNVFRTIRPANGNLVNDGASTEWLYPPSTTANPYPSGVTVPPAPWNTSPDNGTGFPVVVDPVMANAGVVFQDTSTTYKRFAVQSGPFAALWTGTSPVTGPQLRDIPMYPVSDSQYMEVFTGNDRRDMYLKHWFYSSDDLGFDGINPVVPDNPRRDQVPASWEYTQPPADSGGRPGTPGDTFATARRNPSYSWSFVITNRLLQPARYDNPNDTARDPFPYLATNPNSMGDIWILTFFRRSIAEPYRQVRGCFFKGSNVVTLSWPQGVSEPWMRSAAG